MVRDEEMCHKGERESLLSEQRLRCVFVLTGEEDSLRAEENMHF